MNKGTWIPDATEAGRELGLEEIFEEPEEDDACPLHVASCDPEDCHCHE